MAEEQQCTVITRMMDTSCMSQTIGDVATKILQNFVNGLAESFGKLVGALGTFWVHVGAPNLTRSAGSTQVNTPPGSGPLESLFGYLIWISLAIAVLALFFLGALIATRIRTGEGIAVIGRLGWVLGGVILISSATALVTGLLPDTPASSAGGTALFLQSRLWWYILLAAAASVVIGGAQMIWQQRGEPGRDTVRGLLTLIVVAGVGITIISVSVAAADEFSVWILNESLDCDMYDEGGNGQCFGRNVLILIGVSKLAPYGMFITAILMLVAILAALIQMILMIARGAMLVILAGIFPLAASFTNTEMGKHWFKKCVAWLIAFILYKPAAALVYAAAFHLAGADPLADKGEGLATALTGIMMMIIALFALPALMRFVTPMVGSLASGAAGGAAASGVATALPTGAAKIGRSATGAGPSGTGPSSRSTKSGPTGSANPTGPSGSGGSGGSTGAASASGKAAAASSTGGAGAGAASGAGAGAAGAGAAAGAAAGPVGIAAGAAAGAASGAARKTAGAIRDVGEQATGDNGKGPSGSR